MAAVLFADLVGYSRKPVADQFAAKNSFRELLQGVLAPLAADSRIVLDTGDGAAVAFLEDPEHALYVALELREDLAVREQGGRLAPSDLRLGLNLGPVRRMVDLNGQPNLVGEGMNTAERVMSFAAPGETTVSRAFCDAISCLRESYRHLFEPLGHRTDKHGREHEVFRVNGTPLALEEARSSVGIGVRGVVIEIPVPVQAGPDVPPVRKGTGRMWAVAVLVVALVGTMVAWFAGERRPPEASRPLAPAAATLTLSPAKPASAAVAPTPDKATVAPPVEPQPVEVPANPIPKQAVDAEPAPAPSRRERPVQHEAAPTGDPKRCGALTQRAALGEALSPREQEELRRTCR
ncbi:MAG: hypothetical protein FIB05_07895 [Betaproteobacteria bacterium]|nr:hypothetical protein [Betaproteobacteria bacterium]